MKPIDVLKRAVVSYEPYLQESGEMFDPVFAEPTQYGTPYHTLCQAVLADKGDPAERDRRIELAVRGLAAAARYVKDASLPAQMSSIRRETGAVHICNHRDFFWPPVMKTYRILKRLGADVQEIGKVIAQTDIYASFSDRPPGNWAMVWVSGEWMRIQEGLSPFSLEEFDRWLKTCFDTHIMLDAGFYLEPGHPNSYDLFTRYHLADVLLEGYEGTVREQMEKLMETGLRRSLAVQLSDGSLASAFRSTGQTWTVGCQCAYFTHAANYFHERAPELSRLAVSAAQRAFASFMRWQRPDGPYSPVENVLPPGYRVGYEGYSADANYGNTAMGFLAVAILNGFEGPELEPGAPRAACVHIEGDPTYRALAHCGPYSMQLNGFPSERYDGFGLTDLTFGPGRGFHFVSSVKYLSEPGFYNMGIALRQSAGRSEVSPLSKQDFALVAPVEKGPGDASLLLRARPKGRHYAYEIAAGAGADGVSIEERTPGLVGYKTLLVPYLRDGGWSDTTEVKTEVTAEKAVIRFRLGEEVIRLTVDGAIDHILNLPYGYENRRGLCGLLRVDLAKETDTVNYRVAIES